MNRLTIIGNLTRDPELRTTQDGKNVCTFTVAVNRRGREGADYFRVSAWNAMGENCHKYLAKGGKQLYAARSARMPTRRRMDRRGRRLR